MEWNFLKSILYGLLMGFTEFMPVSSNAHHYLFTQLTGTGAEIAVFRLISHFICFLVLLVTCFPRYSRLRRQHRIASIPPRRRKRQPDSGALLDIRVLRTMSIFAVIFAAGSVFMNSMIAGCLLFSVTLVVNGLFLFLCRVRPIGNKDSHSFSGVNAILTGLFCGIGCFSGFSPVGMGLSTSCLQGGSRKYSAENILAVMVPLLFVMLCGDVLFLVQSGMLLSVSFVLDYILTALFSGIGAYFGIVALRFLSVKSDYLSFAFYSWGTALFIAFLYLIV